MPTAYTYNGKVSVTVFHTGKRLEVTIFPSVPFWSFSPRYSHVELHHEITSILDRCNGEHPDLLRAATEAIKDVIHYRIRRRLLTVVDHHCYYCSSALAEHMDDLKCLFGTMSYREQNHGRPLGE